jgi:Peptidase A4 family
VNDVWCTHNTFKRFNVEPGDLVRSEIYKRNGSWRCSVADLTTKSSYSKTFDYNYEGKTDTADWIVESTTLRTGGISIIGKLADFGTMTFKEIRLSPGILKMGDQDSDVSLLGPAGKIVAYPTWTRHQLNIVYR